MIFDAHTHLNGGALPGRNDFFQLASASSPEECRRLELLQREDPHLFYSCGVHPWQSETVPISALTPWLSAASALGEIGMDRVWCTVDLAVQRQVFREQLCLAETLHKPVILHTKGCEQEVLTEIETFPFPVLVHWYSSTEHLEGYLEKDCYFTVGPDYRSNPAVYQLAAAVPLHRLMLESDGVAGASWALERDLAAGDLPGLLQETIKFLARLRGIAPSTMEKQLFQNALHFINASYLHE